MAECELCNDDGTVEVTVLGSPKWPLGKTDCRCPDCLAREKDAEIKELRLIVTTRTALVEREGHKNERLEAENAELQCEIHNRRDTIFAVQQENEKLRSEIQDGEADKRKHGAVAYEREVELLETEKRNVKLRQTLVNGVCAEPSHKHHWHDWTIAAKKILAETETNDA